MTATRPLPDGANPLSGAGGALLGRQRAREALQQLLASTTADQVTVPRRWAEALLQAGSAPLPADDGLARPAVVAAPLVGLSPSRLKRLAAAGLAPGAYREAGPKGRWLFPLPALRELQRAMAAGQHRPVAHGGPGE